MRNYPDNKFLTRQFSLAFQDLLKENIFLNHCHRPVNIHISPKEVGPHGFLAIRTEIVSAAAGTRAEFPVKLHS
jgi:hypothetical protein